MNESAKGDLIRSLQEFNRGNRSIEQLQTDCFMLFKRGVREQLAKPEREALEQVFKNWIDKYDPTLPPRSGAFGRLLDKLDGAIRGRHRVGLDQVRDKTKWLENILSV